MRYGIPINAQLAVRCTWLLSVWFLLVEVIIGAHTYNNYIIQGVSTSTGKSCDRSELQEYTSVSSSRQLVDYKGTLPHLQDGRMYTPHSWCSITLKKSPFLVWLENYNTTMIGVQQLDQLQGPLLNCLCTINSHDKAGGNFLHNSPTFRDR